MTAKNLYEIRIALCGKYREQSPADPEQQSGDPELKAEPERRRDRAVHDSNGPWSPGQQNGLGQRTVQRNLEALDHWTNAPPPKEKNDMKKLDAAKARERQNTIWISLRNPPAVSPNAKVKPVTMIMMTATILATGP